MKICLYKSISLINPCYKITKKPFTRKFMLILPIETLTLQLKCQKQFPFKQKLNQTAPIAAQHSPAGLPICCTCTPQQSDHTHLTLTRRFTQQTLLDNNQKNPTINDKSHLSKWVKSNLTPKMQNPNNITFQIKTEG